MTDKARFLAIRSRLFNLIQRSLEEDPFGKSYDGCLEVMAEYPNYYEDEYAESGPTYYCITLHCYVLGPHRHYEFTGKTMKDALDKLDKTITEWEGTE